MSIPETQEEKDAIELINARFRITELEHQNTELRKDAERYRWLRDINEDPELYLETEPEMLDAAIDAAMKGGE